MSRFITTLLTTGLLTTLLGGCVEVTGAARVEEPSVPMPVQAHSVLAVDEATESREWNLRQIKQSGFRLKAGGGTPVVVAVLDTGADPDQPALKGRMYPVQDIVGQDVHRDRAGDTDFTGIDGNGHGTHVAGIVASVSVGTEVRVLPIKVIPNTGVGDDRLLVAGIEQALAWRDPSDASVRVRILNLSVSSPRVSERLKKAIVKATESGLLVIGASGNEGKGVDFPATMPEVLTVGATTVVDQVADYSCFGEAVDIAAPGGSEDMPVFSTWPSYLTSSDLESGVDKVHTRAGLVGTSMAAPHVSGMAAVMWGLHPHLSAQQIRSGLLAMADDRGKAGPDPFFGFGRLNYQRILGGNSHDAR